MVFSVECFSGFGPWIEFNDRCWLETEFTSDYSAGRLSFEPQNSHTRTEEIVDELATLLTAGRLNDESRKMIKDHFESAANDGYGLRLAQQLIVSTPEFHSTNNILSVVKNTPLLSHHKHLQNLIRRLFIFY